MKVGVSGFAWTGAMAEAHLGLLPQVREFGFAAFEVPMFRPEALPVAALRRAFEANDLACTVCAILPEGVNPISPDAATRRRSCEHLVACIEAAAEMGAEVLGGPLFAPIGYLPGHRPTKDEWGWAVEMFQSVGGLLDACGLTLSIEPVNRSETFFLRTATEARALCEAVGHPRIGVTIDTFHANIEEKNTAAAMAGLGTHLKHVHASENDRGMLGSGSVDFPGILATLTQAGYDGYLVIEGFGFSADEPGAPGALWADPAVSPEAIAVEGLRYLKGLGA